jgi:hypothetical protein
MRYGFLDRRNGRKNLYRRTQDEKSVNSGPFYGVGNYPCLLQWENHDGDKTDGDDTVKNNVSDEQIGRIKLIVNNQEVIVQLHDNPTSRDFLTLLPLTMTLEDYAGNEKMGYLPKKLSTKGVPSGSDALVGDFSYYSPWGNLAIFYKDFGHANGLVRFGKIESGIDELTSINGKFTVTIERID